MSDSSNEAPAIPTTMRAVTYDAFGGVDQLSVNEVPVPVVGPGEVLVQVKAAGVNPVDWKVLSGGLQGLMPHVLPIIPGWDVTGVVVATGPDTPEFSVGDEVMAYARKDTVQHGTFAEYVSVPVRGAALKPAGLDWAGAAGLPLAGGTAIRTLTELVVGPDDVLLIHGAGGGVGSLAVQIAVALGARVIGTGSPANHERLRALGAEPVAYGDGLVDAVRELAPDGVSVVADFVGGVEEQTLAVLASGGRHASIADPTVQEHSGRWIWVRPDAAQLTELARLTETGALTVPVESRFALDQVPAAFTESQSGHTRGKIVIDVA